MPVLVPVLVLVLVLVPQDISNRMFVMFRFQRLPSSAGRATVGHVAAPALKACQYKKR